jgi:hypothetical protein
MLLSGFVIMASLVLTGSELSGESRFKIENIMGYVLLGFAGIYYLVLNWRNDRRNKHGT